MVIIVSARIKSKSKETAILDISKKEKKGLSIINIVKKKFCASVSLLLFFSCFDFINTDGLVPVFYCVHCFFFT